MIEFIGNLDGKCISYWISNHVTRYKPRSVKWDSRKLSFAASSSFSWRDNPNSQPSNCQRRSCAGLLECGLRHIIDGFPSVLYELTPRAILCQFWYGFSEGLRVPEDDRKVLVKKRSCYTESWEGHAWIQTIDMKLKILVSQEKRARCDIHWDIRCKSSGGRWFILLRPCSPCSPMECTRGRI